MCIADIMISDPITVCPSDSLGTAVRRMRKSGFRYLPVVEGDRLVGLLTDYEVNRAAHSPLVAREPWHDHFLLDVIEVSSCMKKDPLTVDPESPIREAAQMVIDQDVPALPVVSGHALVGLVTTSLLVQHLINLLP